MQKSNEELMYATQDEWDFYNKCIQGLPTRDGKNGDTLDKFGIPIPYASGPHIIKHFKSALEIVKPSSILEIGLNYGAGSALLLNLCDANIYSLDISAKDETLDAGGFLFEKYFGRFDFRICDSGKSFSFLKGMRFDMCWLDGGHEYPEVLADIYLCQQLCIEYLLFDDWYPQFGPGVQAAVAMFPDLELVKDMDNLRLYTWRKF